MHSFRKILRDGRETINSSECRAGNSDPLRFLLLLAAPLLSVGTKLEETNGPLLESLVAGFHLLLRGDYRGSPWPRGIPAMAGIFLSTALSYQWPVLRCSEVSGFMGAQGRTLVVKGVCARALSLRMKKRALACSDIVFLVYRQYINVFVN